LRLVKRQPRGAELCERFVLGHRGRRVPAGKRHTSGTIALQTHVPFRFTIASGRRPGEPNYRTKGAAAFLAGTVSRLAA